MMDSSISAISEKLLSIGFIAMVFTIELGTMTYISSAFSDCIGQFLNNQVYTAHDWIFQLQYLFANNCLECHEWWIQSAFGAVQNLDSPVDFL